MVRLGILKWYKNSKPSIYIYTRRERKRDRERGRESKPEIQILS